MMTDQNSIDVKMDKRRRRKGLLLIAFALVLWAVYAVCDMDKADNTSSLSKDLEFTIRLHMWDQPEHPFGDWVSSHNRHISDLIIERKDE